MSNVVRLEDYRRARDLSRQRDQINMMLPFWPAVMTTEAYFAFLAALQELAK